MYRIAGNYFCCPTFRINYLNIRAQNGDVEPNALYFE